MRKLKRVRETDLPKLEALLTQPRSAQLLLDLTMNRQEVITDDNIEEILDMMRKTTASEVRDQAREESKKAIEEITLNARAEIGRQREYNERLADSLAAKERALSDARALLGQREGADIQMMRRWAEEAANFERRATKAEQLVLVVLAGVLAAGGWLLDTDAMPTHAATIAYVVAILTLLFAIGLIIPGFPNAFRPFIMKIRDRKFRRKVERAGREDLLRGYDVDWESLRVSKR